MLKNEAEYRRAVEEVTQQRGRLQQQTDRLRGEGLSDEQVRVAMEPLWAYHRQLAADIERYERIKRGEFDVLRNLERLGELLIAVRIYLGLTQAELAERLGVDPSVVCRDERNEYHGVTLERAVKILNVMGVELRTSVEVPGCGPAMPSCETPGGHRPSAARTGPALAGRTG
ncbi:MAG TPA: helix-turn-helix transcriptional regulator [Candidatus Anammoximicrobium sp.]|nr:helix-turn-helix transcriptional regulator [Candidatus Anammoximicrobium sp.]